MALLPLLASGVMCDNRRKRRMNRYTYVHTPTLPVSYGNKQDLRNAMLHWGAWRIPLPGNHRRTLQHGQGRVVHVQATELTIG